MPPLTMWDPRSSVKLWMNKVDRRVKGTHKAKEQILHKGIFAEPDKKYATIEERKQHKQIKHF